MDLVLKGIKNKKTGGPKLEVFLSDDIRGI
jgi:hypothetical protein